MPTAQPTPDPSTSPLSQALPPRKRSQPIPRNLKIIRRRHLHDLQILLAIRLRLANRRHKPGKPNQKRIQQQPTNAPVPVVERVDADEILTHVCGEVECVDRIRGSSARGLVGIHVRVEVLHELRHRGFEAVGFDEGDFAADAVLVAEIRIGVGGAVETCVGVWAAVIGQNALAQDLVRFADEGFGKPPVGARVAVRMCARAWACWITSRRDWVTWAGLGSRITLCSRTRKEAASTYSSKAGSRVAEGVSTLNRRVQSARVVV
jgi:hypothetical protein